MEQKQAQTKNPDQENKGLADELTKSEVESQSEPESKITKHDERPSTQHSMQVAYITDNIIILKDGSFRAVIKAASINFDLISTQEKEAVEYAYQSFLNSLYFPIQINIKSRQVDVENYLEKIQQSMKQQNNMLLSLLAEDYLDFVGGLIEYTSIVNKSFYIVVPYRNDEFNLNRQKQGLKSFGSKLIGFIFNHKNETLTINKSSLDKARRELRYRVALIVDGLRNCGVHSEALETKQLVELYYDAYNPDAVTPKHLGSFDDLETPFVTKGINPK